MLTLRATPARAAPCCAGGAAVRLSRRAGLGRACAPVGRRARLAVRAVQAASPAADAAAGSADGLLDVVVVGGGISGLCTAQALITKHAGAARRVLVTEARDRVGGNITSVSVRATRRDWLRCVCASACAAGVRASASGERRVCLFASDTLGAARR
jgi:hypothetical protein